MVLEVSRKALKLVLLVLGVSIVVFWLLSISPVDPLKANYGTTAVQGMSAAQRAKLEAYWGVNQPFWTSYTHWLGDALHGDFGTSLRYNAPVVSIIWAKFANSALLLAVAWLISGVLGFALGVLAGGTRGRLADRLITTICYALASTPAFWLGMLALMVFAVWLRWLPIGFSATIGAADADISAGDLLRHMILPALTLSVVGIANITLQTREKLVEAMDSRYFAYARARGESHWGVIRRHGLRNIILPALTLQFASIAEIFGGSILVEQVFSYPGLGQATVQAGLGSDSALLAGIAVVSAVIVFLGNAAASALYGVVDTRIGGGRSE